jgi:hypothetical protein
MLAAPLATATSITARGNVCGSGLASITQLRPPMQTPIRL